MPTFSYAQLEQLWINAGGNAQLAPTMAAIAMAESAGNSQAYNPSGAVGLWQIMGTECGPGSYDPITNARQALCKYNEQGLCAWQTWSGQGCADPSQYNNSYATFLRQGIPPDPNVPNNATAGMANTLSLQTGQQGSGTSPSGSGGNPSGSGGSGGSGGILDSIVHTIINPIIGVMAGIVGIAAGGAMMILGILAIISESQTGRKLERGAFQLGVAAFAPEARATTFYESGQTPAGEPLRRRVVARRRRPIRIAGQEVRPGYQRTDVTQEVLRNAAWQTYEGRENGNQRPRSSTSAGAGHRRPPGTPRGRRPGTHGSGVGGGVPPSGRKPPRERTGGPGRGRSGA